METKATRPIHLQRIDAAQNMRRFYMLVVQPTLFGGASVIRNWGRIGTSGQTMIETFDDEEAAAVGARAGRRLEEIHHEIEKARAHLVEILQRLVAMAESLTLPQADPQPG